MTEDDIPWLKYLCLKKYPDTYDPISTERWFRTYVLASPMMFFPVCTDNAFCIAMLSTVPWTPAEFECNVIFVCAEDGAMWEALTLLRASVNWARRRKCTTWRISSDTDHDLAPLARRLGATELSPRFCLRL
jgi:hypothetical protein